MKDETNKNLTHLQDSGRYNKYPDKYDPSVLETFGNKFPTHEYLVTLNCPEFSSNCEITHQPDYGKIYINYIPNEKLVESKSLKLYMFSFRNHACFHENTVNTIGKDLVELLDPKFLEVKGEYLPRGGISIDPIFVYGKDDEWKKFARQRLLDYNSQQRIVNNR